MQFSLASCHYVPLSAIITLMEAVCTSETSVYSDTTQSYIPEDSYLHNRCCQNLKSHILLDVFHNKGNVLTGYTFLVFHYIVYFFLF
jgi:hypothetical protein